jgi:hypothetical protein
MISSFLLGGFALSFISRWRRSRSRRLASRAFFSSSVSGLSGSTTEDSEFRRGRGCNRRWGDSDGPPAGLGPLPCILLALSASSCDLDGRWFGGGPRRRGGTFSPRGGPGGPRGRFAGGRAPSGRAGFLSSRVKVSCERSTVSENLFHILKPDHTATATRVPRGRKRADLPIVNSEYVQTTPLRSAMSWCLRSMPCCRVISEVSLANSKSLQDRERDFEITVGVGGRQKETRATFGCCPHRQPERLRDCERGCLMRD